MNEVVPSVLDWSTLNPSIDSIVHSHWVPAAGALIDPIFDEDVDLEAWFGNDRPQRILLSNRHHSRSSERIVEAFGATVHCHSAGLHNFTDSPLEVEGFEWGDQPAPGIEALEIGALCDEETALLIRDAGAIVIADAITHEDGELGFFSDDLLGDDPEAVKQGIRDSFGRHLDRDFDALLFAHGDPVPSGGRDQLREFCS